MKKMKRVVVIVLDGTGAGWQHDAAQYGDEGANTLRHVIEQIERYGVDTTRRGLVFCSRREEAHRLAHMFNERGFRSVALDGSSTDQQRESAIDRLECNRSLREDWIEFIFTVDIFNEGVDIPSVNLIVMMRPTESAIIFIRLIMNMPMYVCCP